MVVLSLKSEVYRPLAEEVWRKLPPATTKYLCNKSPVELREAHGEDVFFDLFIIMSHADYTKFSFGYFRLD